MTDRRELEELQRKARRMGRTAEFVFDKDGWIDSVYYRDPKGPGLQKTGLTLTPIGFAERERAKPGGRRRR